MKTDLFHTKKNVKNCRGDTVEVIEVIERNTEESKSNREKAPAGISQSVLDKRKL